MMRVLYVEDDRVHGLLFEECLRQMPDVECQIAEDGEQALQLAADWHPHVLVVDAHLGNTDGFTLLGSLRQIEGMQRIPAILCSADTDQATLQRALNVGYIEYWSKPLDLTRTPKALHRIVGQSPPRGDATPIE